MASSATMQTLLLLARTPLVTRVSNRTTAANFLSPSNSTLRVQRNAVKCMAKQERGEFAPSTPLPTSTPQPISSPPKPKASTNVFDLLAFSGPAPERLNGRLAMIGFVAAMAVEVYNGQDVFAQIARGGIPWFFGTSVVLSLASLVPLSKGVSVQSKSDGIMTSYAELWNGGYAMLGLVALAFTEFVKGGALV